MYFLLPFKGINEAKSRWSGIGERRGQLVLGLLEQNLRAVTSVAGKENVFLVSPDRRSLEHFPFCESFLCSGHGLNQDLNEARRWLVQNYPRQPICVLLPDLPTLTGGDVVSLLQSVESNPVALCPDEDDHGTNALVLREWESLDFLFEGASFERHLAACRDLKIEPLIIRSSGLSRDCDNLDDLERFCLL